MKARWLSEEALQTAEEKRDEKGKGERKRYIQLNAEFQRIARSDKKDFLNEKCKEIEENNRMEKTRNLKKIGDIKGTFQSRIGMIKDINSNPYQKRLRRGSKNTRKNYRILMTQITTMLWSLT